MGAYSREERIQQIKDCGQSLIDNAESIVADFRYPGGMKVTIDIAINKIPTITAERCFYAESFIDGTK